MLLSTWCLIPSEYNTRSFAYATLIKKEETSISHSFLRDF